MHYAMGRKVLLELGQAMTADDAARPVPACPGWTVKDVYAHLAGIAADAVAGRLEGTGTDPWTARQVEERAGDSLLDVLKEWTDTGPRFEDALRAMGDSAPPRVVIDQWSHEQDIRGAVAKPGSRNVPRLAFVVDTMLSGWARRWDDNPHPSVAVRTERTSHQLGSGEPELTLTTTDFELARALLGRRSRGQYLRMGWSPDDEAVVGPVVDDLHGFTLAADDVSE